MVSSDPEQHDLTSYGEWSGLSLRWATVHPQRWNILAGISAAKRSDISLNEDISASRSLTVRATVRHHPSPESKNLESVGYRTHPTSAVLSDGRYFAKRVTLSLALRSSGDAGRGFGRVGAAAALVAG
jgi:hypothetical protein